MAAIELEKKKLLRAVLQELFKDDCCRMKFELFIRKLFVIAITWSQCTYIPAYMLSVWSVLSLLERT